MKLHILPEWVLTGTRPAIYDVDSDSIIEQTARVYAAMKELQKEVTEYIEKLEKSLKEFQDGVIKDQDEFKACINKIMHDYILKIDEKIKMQDLVINESITYIKENIQESTNKAIDEMLANNELYIKSVYDSANESLSIVVSEVTE